MMSVFNVEILKKNGYSDISTVEHDANTIVSKRLE
jgi:hypothetical protein